MGVGGVLCRRGSGPMSFVGGGVLCGSGPMSYVGVVLCPM